MEKTVWKISEINNAVKQVIEGALGPFWLEGEIGTITVHSSGHVYIVLKDRKSQLKAVFWRGASKVKAMQLKTGSQIEAYGRLTVYEVRGEYQFSIQSVRPVGLGQLQQKFEEIKAKLNAEGLFSTERKKAIPLLPRVVGVVTSPTGAAVQDFLNVVNRRFPNVNIKIYPALVQGAGAEKDVSAGVKYFNQKCLVDVIVVTRGGGSMEDLWAFNDEVLARTIADSEIPVISAVGHEIDFTISDFVADLRVPTPSAAAELVVGNQETLKEKIELIDKRLKNTLLLYMERIKRKLEMLSNSYVFQEPFRLIYEKQQFVDDCMQRITHACELKLQKMQSRLNNAKTAINALNPDSVINRGYSILRNRKSGELVTSSNITSGTKVSAKVQDGSIDLVVE